MGGRGWGVYTSTQARPNMWEQESLAMLELSHYGNPLTALLWHYWGKKRSPSVIDLNVIVMIKDYLSICNDFHHVPHTVTIMRVICIEAKIILAVTLRFTTRMLEDLHRMLNSFHHYPNDDNDELYVLGIKQQGSDGKKNDE